MLTLENAYVVGLTGDWHQDLAWANVTLDTFYEYGVKYLFQLGDFGFSLDNTGRKFLFKVNQKLAKNNQFLYVTLGNHENYTHFLKHAVPVEGLLGWVQVQGYENIFFAIRGARWKIDEVSFVSLGGANSIDRVGHVEGKSWWREEQISKFDVLATTVFGHADVMLTHDAPLEVDLFKGKSSGSDDWTLTEIAYAELSREKMSEAVRVVKPNLLFHGHYHFYADHVTAMEDKTGNLFNLHSVGLDMNRSKDNMALLMLDTLSFEMIPASLSALKLVRAGVR